MGVDLVAEKVVEMGPDPTQLEYTFDPQ